MDSFLLFSHMWRTVMYDQIGKYFIPHCAIQIGHHVCILGQTNWAVSASKTSWRFCLLELCVMRCRKVNIYCSSIQPSYMLYLSLIPIPFIFCTCVASFHILASAYIFESMIWADASSGSMLKIFSAAYLPRATSLWILQPDNRTRDTVTPPY